MFNYKLTVAVIAAAAAAPALATAVAAQAPKVAPAKPAPAKPAAQQATTRANIIKNVDTSFKAVDTNGDRVLTQAELAAAEAKGVRDRVAVARQRMDAEFGKLDTNKDGQLSKVEFMAAAPQAPTATPTGAEPLAQLDKNKDAKVSIEEYRAPLLARFDALDTNHDGTISAAERQAAQAQAAQTTKR